MESWRGRRRRVGREALGWLAAAGGRARIPAATRRAAVLPRPGKRRSNGAAGPQWFATTAVAGGHDAGAGPARRGGVQDQIDRGAMAREQNHLNAPRARSAEAAPEGAAPLASVPEYNRVPSWLQTGAAWSWRLLLLAFALYLIARAIGVLYIVVVPCTAALLLTALLQPLTGRLRRVGLPGLAATWAPCSSPPSCSAVLSCW